MPEYLSPGVYVEEISTGPKPIEGVSTSVAGFLGPTERGPEDVQYLTSWLEFGRWYGGHLGVDKSYLSYSVQGFFDNGGKRCFVGRIVEGTGVNPPTALISSRQAADDLQVYAVGRGAWGDRIFIKIIPSTQAQKRGGSAAAWVRVQVLYFSGDKPAPDKIINPFVTQNPNDNAGKVRAGVVEDFDDLSPDPTASNSILTVINAGSKLIRAKGRTKTTLAIILQQPADPFQSLQGGGGGLPKVFDDYLGNLDPILPGDDENLLGRGCGFEAMDTIDGVSLLLAPDHVDNVGVFTGGGTLTNELFKRCELLKDRFAVLSAKRNQKPQNLRPSFDSTFGAQYYPWIWVYDPVTRDNQLIPPAGHMAGIIARTDIEQGVFKAPANAVVVGATDLEKPVPKGDQDLLNPVGINCIRDFTSHGRGIRLWGARTMSSDPEWKYVNVRRLFIYLERSIDEGTQWVVFEPNSEVTWGRVQRSVSNFLMTVWRAGGLFGSKPEEAFFVKCDRTTMSEDDIQNGRLICYIGVCPVRPAEFVIFRIGQKTADAVA